MVTTLRTRAALSGLGPERPFEALIGNSLVWDNHGCMPLRPGDCSFLPQLQRVRKAGVHVITLNVGFGRQTRGAVEAMIRTFQDWISDRPKDFMIVKSVDDIETTLVTGKLGVCFDIEGMDALDGDPRNIASLYELGVRWMLAAYNLPNIAGGGCLSIDDGLTTFGRQVIAEMNRVGVVVCGSHCGYRTAREMIDVSADPVIFSHSNPRALWDHPRNIPDDLIKACAARGGVIGINGFGPFLGAQGATIETFVDHIEYSLDLVGDDHVGIGLDYVFDQKELANFISADPDTFPPAFYSGSPKSIPPWRLPGVAKALLHRGYALATLRKLFGENHVRIASQVWR